MKQTLPVVHCTYTEAEKSLAELLEESFRLYLIRILATPEMPVEASTARKNCWNISDNPDAAPPPKPHRLPLISTHPAVRRTFSPVKAPAPHCRPALVYPR